MQTDGGENVASERKQRANKRNAQNSTGPRTGKGKAVSRLNALKHGLTARSLVVLGERHADFETMRTGIEEALMPADAIERLLAGAVVAAAWRLQRASRVEAAMLEAAIARSEEAAADARKWSFVYQPPGEIETILDSLGGKSSEPVITDREEHDRWLRVSQSFADVYRAPEVVQSDVFAKPEWCAGLASLNRYEAHLWRRFNESLQALHRYRSSRVPAVD
jgi:hypothetical protein